jgi:hypothetical protein
MYDCAYCILLHAYILEQVLRRLLAVPALVLTFYEHYDMAAASSSPTAQTISSRSSSPTAAASSLTATARAAAAAAVDQQQQQQQQDSLVKGVPVISNLIQMLSHYSNARAALPAQASAQLEVHQTELINLNIFSNFR